MSLIFALEVILGFCLIIWLIFEPGRREWK
jgi:hypothetical protein